MRLSNVMRHLFDRRVCEMRSIGGGRAAALAEAASRFMEPIDPDPACRYCGGPPPRDGALDWSFVPATYVISVQERDDRAVHAAAQLHRLGLCRRAMFYRPPRHPARPVVGIWESHRAVAGHALASGHPHVLVLEDDALFTSRLTSRRLRRVATALDGLPDDWTIFFLGHFPFWARYENHSVLRVSSGCAHAYFGSRRLFEWLVATPNETKRVPRRLVAGKGIDAAYARLPGTFAFFPMLAIQDGTPSDHFNYLRAKVRRRFYLRVLDYENFERLYGRMMLVAEVAALTLGMPASAATWLLRSVEQLHTRIRNSMSRKRPQATHSR